MRPSSRDPSATLHAFTVPCALPCPLGAYRALSKSPTFTSASEYGYGPCLLDLQIVNHVSGGSSTNITGMLGSHHPGETTEEERPTGVGKQHHWDLESGDVGHVKGVSAFAAVISSGAGLVQNHAAKACRS